MEQKSKVDECSYRRTHERKKYETGIVFYHANRLYSACIKNLSLGGAYIETHCVNQFSAEDIVTVSIPYSSGNNNITRRGRVKWLNNIGFAVEFI